MSAICSRMTSLAQALPFARRLCQRGEAAGPSFSCSALTVGASSLQVTMVITSINRSSDRSHSRPSLTRSHRRWPLSSWYFCGVLWGSHTGPSHAPARCCLQPVAVKEERKAAMTQESELDSHLLPPAAGSGSDNVQDVVHSVRSHNSEADQSLFSERYMATHSLTSKASPSGDQRDLSSEHFSCPEVGLPTTILFLLYLTPYQETTAEPRLASYHSAPHRCPPPTSISLLVLCSKFWEPALPVSWSLTSTTLPASLASPPSSVPTSPV